MAIIGITELQAVNQMLRAAGEATVSAVGSGNTRDADANTMLDEVAERIQGQKDSIIKEQRSDRAIERHETLAAKAQADQDEAEAERATDLEGL
jgi:hypothetical protein